MEQRRLGEPERAVRIAARVDELRLRAEHAPERLRAIGCGEALAERREVDALDELAVRGLGVAVAQQGLRQIEVELADEVHVARADRAPDAAAEREDRALDVALGQPDRRARSIDHRDEERPAGPVTRLGEDAGAVLRHQAADEQTAHAGVQRLRVRYSIFGALRGLLPSSGRTATRIGSRGWDSTFFSS